MYEHVIFYEQIAYEFLVDMFKLVRMFVLIKLVALLRHKFQVVRNETYSASAECVLFRAVATKTREPSEHNIMSGATCNAETGTRYALSLIQGGYSK